MRLLFYNSLHAVLAPVYAVFQYYLFLRTSRDQGPVVAVGFDRDWKQGGLVGSGIIQRLGRRNRHPIARFAIVRHLT